MRFVAVLSPFVEYEVLNSKRSVDELISFFEETRDLCDELKHFITFLIPNSIRGFFYTSNRGRVFLSALEEDTQRSILFQTGVKEDPCELDDLSNIFESSSVGGDDLNVYRKIQSYLLKRNIPFIVDYKEREVKKEDCSTCGLSDLLCSYAIDFSLFVPGDKLGKLREFIIQNENEIFEYLKGAKKYDIKMLKYSAFVQGFFQGMGPSELKNLSLINCSSGFLSDIKKCPVSDFKEISYCGFLALAFPSIRDEKSESSFKVDWHKNPGVGKVGEVSVYRADVLPRGRLGYTGSGTKRILVGEKAGVKKLLGYTDAHDFEPDLIRARCKTF